MCLRRRTLYYIIILPHRRRRRVNYSDLADYGSIKSLHSPTPPPAPHAPSRPCGRFPETGFMCMIALESQHARDVCTVCTVFAASRGISPSTRRRRRGDHDCAARSIIITITVIITTCSITRVAHNTCLIRIYDRISCEKPGCSWRPMLFVGLGDLAWAP